MTTQDVALQRSTGLINDDITLGTTDCTTEEEVQARIKRMYNTIQKQGVRLKAIFNPAAVKEGRVTAEMRRKGAFGLLTDSAKDHLKDLNVQNAADRAQK